MTDFGKRAAGAAVAHKTTHQDGGADEISIAGLSGQAADDQPAAAHDLGGTKHQSSTLAQLNAKVSDANLDDSGDPRTPSGHKASHQDGGADEISVAGLIGTTPRALLGDATAGRNFRASKFIIQAGTTQDTIKCTLSPAFNGDTIAETDNIAMGATVGAYTLDSDGYFLTIDHAYLSGNVLLALGLLAINVCGTQFTLHAYSLTTDIMVVLRHPETGGPYSMSTLVDVGDIHTKIAYITDA